MAGRKVELLALSTRFLRLRSLQGNHQARHLRCISSNSQYSAAVLCTSHSQRQHIFYTGNCKYSSAQTQTQKTEDEPDFHTIISDKEAAQGQAEKHDFQAETRMLLDIVAKSLYSEKEVFIRELISNASDALEKLRYLQVTDNIPAGRPLEIHIATDKLSRTFIIQDTGIGMTKPELIDNLGIIARSGSKAFLKELEAKGKTSAESIIGQFGVGFYSSFMVADKVELFTKSFKEATSGGYHWESDGSGSYEIKQAENVQQGTKIVVHLKSGDCLDYADDKIVEEVIRKYSNFVTCPIYLNGKRLNTVQALWTMDPKDVKAEQHDDFYRYIAHNQHDRPRYCLHYKTDAPINIRALLYVSDMKPSMFDMAPSAESSVALYSRRVMIQNKCSDILPKWMRFFKGVVDSEDIPLNLSRELLQKSALISKLRTVMSSRVFKFLQEQMKRDKSKYDQFYADYGVFFKEGILMGHDQSDKEELAKLLLFESSNQRPGVRVSLPEYASRMQAGQRDIFYLCAPSRALAESSPYYEALKEKSFEVLFCYEPYDELTLLQLQQFDRKRLTSVEKQLWTDKSDTGPKTTDDAALKSDDLKALTDWMKEALGRRVHEVKVTGKLSTYPCMITVEEMGAARHFVRTQFASLSEDQRYALLKPTLEVNPAHALNVKLNDLRQKDPELAKMLLNQVFDNAMITAGLSDDSRSMVTRLNELLTRMVEKTG